MVVVNDLGSVIFLLLGHVSCRETNRYSFMFGFNQQTSHYIITGQAWVIQRGLSTTCT
jgi:hypothetical protein